MVNKEINNKNLTPVQHSICASYREQINTLNFTLDAPNKFFAVWPVCSAIMNLLMSMAHEHDIKDELFSQEKETNIWEKIEGNGKIYHVLDKAKQRYHTVAEPIMD